MVSKGLKLRILVCLEGSAIAIVVISYFIMFFVAGLALLGIVSDMPTTIFKLMAVIAGIYIIADCVMCSTFIVTYLADQKTMEECNEYELISIVVNSLIAPIAVTALIWLVIMSTFQKPIVSVKPIRRYRLI